MGAGVFQGNNITALIVNQGDPGQSYNPWYVALAQPTTGETAPVNSITGLNINAKTVYDLGDYSSNAYTNEPLPDISKAFNCILVKLHTSVLGTVINSFNLHGNQNPNIKTSLPYAILCENQAYAVGVRASLSYGKLNSGTYTGTLSGSSVTYLLFPNPYGDDLQFDFTKSNTEAVTIDFTGVNFDMSLFPTQAPVPSIQAANSGGIATQVLASTVLTAITTSATAKNVTFSTAGSSVDIRVSYDGVNYFIIPANSILTLAAITNINQLYVALDSGVGPYTLRMIYEN